MKMILKPLTFKFNVDISDATSGQNYWVSFSTVKSILGLFIGMEFTFK
jgi:hypothetical protein